MIDGTIPAETNGAVQALEQRRLALLELLETISKHDYTKGFQINGLISTEIDKLTERLDIDNGTLWEIEDE